jgi:iduronate 2-sulfatase
MVWRGCLFHCYEVRLHLRKGGFLEMHAVMRYWILLGCLMRLCVLGAEPNVLFIVVDDLNVALGCYGDKVARTPQMDALAARGVRYEQAQAQFPVCGPSRVSFLTGRRPENTGVYVLDTAAHVALPKAQQLQEHFKQRGYHTVGLGKVAHHAGLVRHSGWDKYLDDKGEDAEEKEAIQLRHSGKTDGTPQVHVLSSDGARTRDGVNVRRLCEMLRKRGQDKRSFFYALGVHKPHLPWTVPKRFYDAFPDKVFTEMLKETAMVQVPGIGLQTELAGFPQPHSRAEALRGYYSCVAFIDELLGQVFMELKDSGLEDETVVLLTSDHGFHLGDHGGLWAKLSAFTQATRVPFILAGPGVPHGRVIREPVELLDVYPTLVGLTKGTLPEGLEGRGLETDFSSSADPVAAPERYAYSMVYHYDVAKSCDVLGRTVIAREWRYTQWGAGHGEELYVRVQDAGEYVNVVTEQTALKNQAQALLARHPQPKPGPVIRPRAMVKAQQPKSAH